MSGTVAEHLPVRAALLNESAANTLNSMQFSFPSWTRLLTTTRRLILDFMLSGIGQGQVRTPWLLILVRIAWSATYDGEADAGWHTFLFERLPIAQRKTFFAWAFTHHTTSNRMTNSLLTF
jgi:hypothetical protein